MSPIPVANPGAAYRAAAPAIDAAVRRVLDSGQYLHGQECAAFEEELAKTLGSGYVVGVASGTDALRLSLKALNIGPGAEVATVSWTAVATVAAIVETGARPVFVDVAPDDLTMDPSHLAASLTSRTRAIIVVHLYGQPARLPEILAIANKAGLPVVEDCAQAHGATLQGRAVGRWGRLGAFSFYPTKNLGALGDAGAVVTDDYHLADRVRQLREYGWVNRRPGPLHGQNSRLDEIQAAVLRVKLPGLEVANSRRRLIATAYDACLAGTAIRPVSRSGSVVHQYVVRTPDRDQLQAHLAGLGIGTAIHYAVPAGQYPAYRGLGRALPVTEQAAHEVLSLPVYPGLTEVEVAYIGESLQTFAAGRSP